MRCGRADRHLRARSYGGNDGIRAEAEQKRLEAAVEQSEAALAGRQDEMERRKAQLDAARARAEDAAKQEEALAADIETRTAELERLAEGDDAFLAQQRSLAERLSAKRMEQLARQKDARAGSQPDRSAGKTGQRR